MPPTATATARASPGDVAALDRWLNALSAHIAHMDRAPPASSFAAEFDSLQRIDRDFMRAAQVEFAAALAPENALRNRYPNILANEASRWRGPPNIPYINANCIDGIHPTTDSASRGYIAAQAPPPATMPAFWAMIYEEHSPAIITLNRPQEVAAYVPKCDRYWPPPEQCCTMGDYYVQAGTESELGPIVVRRFTVGKLATTAHTQPPPAAGAWDQTPVRSTASDGGYPQPADIDDLQRIGEPHHVVQLQYTEWPDQAVPDHPHGMLRLCALLDDLLVDAPRSRSGAAGRPVVHCSAGVGRTGTFISVHKLLNAVYLSYPLSGGRGPAIPKVPAIVASLKSQRSKSVQTAEQYRFIFVALLQGAKAHRDAMAADALPS